MIRQLAPALVSRFKTVITDQKSSGLFVGEPQKDIKEKVVQSVCSRYDMFVHSKCFIRHTWQLRRMVLHTEVFVMI